jgi:cytochrome c-type biogenesis protein CcmH
VTAPVPSARPLRRSWGPWIPLFVVLAVALLIGTLGDTGPSTNEERVTAIARTVKCPECEGESVADSNSPLSRAARIEIAELVQAGMSDDDIRAVLEEKYRGLSLTPTSTGVAGLIWVLPVVLLVFSLAGLALAFRRWSHERPTVAATDGDRALVQAALDEEHQRARGVDGSAEP